MTLGLASKSARRNTSVISLKSVDPTTESWKWWPSAEELREHYLHDLGFLACLIMLISMTIFCIAGIMALPGIYNALDTPAKLDGAYWTPQIIGGIGFVVSGALFTIETQQHWWLPAPGVLGWYVGICSLIGGLGFTLCPVFGLVGSHWATYQACVSSFWGSWAFLIGSTIQWYESLNKHPVEKRRSS